VHFDATLSVLPPCLPPNQTSYVDRKPSHRAPRIGSTALQHSKMKVPFFSPSSRRASQKHCPAPGKSHPQGLATLSAASGSLTREDLFQSPTLLGFALRSFSLPRGSLRLFQTPLSALAIPEETSRPLPVASAAFSPQRSRAPFTLPKRLTPVRASAPLGFPTSQALPPPNRPEKRLPFQDTLSSFNPLDLTTQKIPDLRALRSGRLGSLPP
jgi:hypothetical protein